MTLDIIGIDTPTIDIIQTPEGVIKSLGGSVVNSIVALRRLGLSTGLIVRVGADEDGKEFLNEFDSLDINREKSVIDNGYSTPKCHIKVTGTTREIISMGFAKPFQLAEIDENYLKSAKSIYVRPEDNIFGLCIEVAKKNNMKVFVSLHNTNVSGKTELILNSGADVILGNHKEVKGIESIIQQLQNKNAIVVATKGRDGCVVFDKNGQVEYPGFKVNSKDPTGAGDAFAAGFIYGKLNGWDIGKISRFANAMGALTTTEYGARTRNITFQDVWNLTGDEKNAI